MLSHLRRGVAGAVQDLRELGNKEQSHLRRGESRNEKVPHQHLPRVDGMVILDPVLINLWGRHQIKRETMSRPGGQGGLRRLSRQRRRNNEMQLRTVSRTGALVRVESVHPHLWRGVQGKDEGVRFDIPQWRRQSLQGSPQTERRLQQRSMPSLYPMVGLVPVFQDLWDRSEGEKPEVRGLQSSLFQALLSGPLTRNRQMQHE